MAHTAHVRTRPLETGRVEHCPGKHLQMRKATLTGVTVVAWVTGVTGVVMFIAHVNLVYTRCYPSRCYGGTYLRYSVFDLWETTEALIKIAACNECNSVHTHPALANSTRSAIYYFPESSNHMFGSEVTIN